MGGVPQWGKRSHANPHEKPSNSKALPLGLFSTFNSPALSTHCLRRLMIKSSQRMYRARPSSISSKSDLSSSSFLSVSVFPVRRDSNSKIKGDYTRLGCIECHHVKRIRKSPVRHFTGRLLGVVHQLGLPSIGFGSLQQGCHLEGRPPSQPCVYLLLSSVVLERIDGNTGCRSYGNTEEEVVGVCGVDIAIARVDRPPPTHLENAPVTEDNIGHVDR